MEKIKKFKWNSRLIVVSENNTQALNYFDNIKSQYSKGWNERQLKVVPVSSNQFFKKYHQNSFAALVGLDGTTKSVYKSPPNIETIFQTIDAMPMRRQELKK